MKNPKNQSTEEWLDDFGDVEPIAKIREKASNQVKQYTNAKGSHSPLKPNPKIDWRAELIGFATTEEIMKEISDVQFCWMKLLVQSHMTVICSKGNGGKTTLMLKACEDLVRSGYEVYYVNADASADQLKFYHNHSIEYGYTLLAPDLHLGKSPSGIVDLLYGMSKADENYSGTVIVLDTMKKFASSLMNKELVKKFTSTLRSLTAKGMTVICLAHTNKHDSKDGKPIYEGTGDVRNDFDELIYLVPVKNEDGSLVVSTDIDKIRASGIKNYTFDISPNRNVTVRDKFEDTLSLHQFQLEMERDSKVIDFIYDSIKNQSKPISDIQAESKARGMAIGKDAIRKIVTKYSSEFCETPLWRSIPTGRNGYRFGLIKDEISATQ